MPWRMRLVKSFEVRGQLEVYSLDSEGLRVHTIALELGTIETCDDFSLSQTLHHALTGYMKSLVKNPEYAHFQVQTLRTGMSRLPQCKMTISLLPITPK